MSVYDKEDDGVRFDPTDELLIEYYLSRMLRGELREDLIVKKNVYAKEPWLLDHNMDPFFKKDEWYYFVTRTQVSKKKTGCGKMSKRMIDNGGGTWTADAKEDIIDERTRKIIGIKRTLTFNKSNNNNNKKKKQKREDGTYNCVIDPGSDNSWIMTEYMLPEGETFEELVLCKIHEIKKSKEKKDAQVEAMKVRQEVEEEDWVGDFMEKYMEKGLEAVLNINNEDQHCSHLGVDSPSSH